MLRFGAAKPQYVLLLTTRNKYAENESEKKKWSQAGFELSTSACKLSALPSELWGSIDWAAHACMASVD